MSGIRNGVLLSVICIIEFLNIVSWKVLCCIVLKENSGFLVVFMCLIVNIMSIKLIVMMLSG